MLSKQLRNPPKADIEAIIANYLLNIKSRHERDMLVDAIYSKPLRRVIFLPFGCISKYDPQSEAIFKALLRITGMYLHILTINDHLKEKNSHFIVQYIQNVYQVLRSGFLLHAALAPPFKPDCTISMEYLNRLSFCINEHMKFTKQCNSD